MNKCDECGAEAPAHYASCKSMPLEMRKVIEANAEYDRKVDARRSESDAEREKRVAPYGRNRNGVPNRPNEPCVITVQCTNKAMAQRWAEVIRSEGWLKDALPIAIVKVEDWPE